MPSTNHHVMCSLLGWWSNTFLLIAHLKLWRIGCDSLGHQRSWGFKRNEITRNLPNKSQGIVGCTPMGNSYISPIYSGPMKMGHNLSPRIPWKKKRDRPFVTQNSAGEKVTPNFPGPPTVGPLRVLRSWPPFALKVRPFAWQEQKWQAKMPAESHAVEIQGRSTTKKGDEDEFVSEDLLVHFLKAFLKNISIKHRHYIHYSSRF